jgi:hypothetical protein
MILLVPVGALGFLAKPVSMAMLVFTVKLMSLVKLGVYDFAHVCGQAKVYDTAQLYGGAQADDEARIYGAAHVYDSTEVLGATCVSGLARVFDNVSVYNVWVSNDDTFFGKATVLGDNFVSDFDRRDSEIRSSGDIKSSAEEADIA